MNDWNDKTQWNIGILERWVKEQYPNIPSFHFSCFPSKKKNKSKNKHHYHNNECPEHIVLNIDFIGVPEFF